MEAGAQHAQVQQPTLSPCSSLSLATMMSNEGTLTIEGGIRRSGKGEKEEREECVDKEVCSRVAKEFCVVLERGVGANRETKGGVSSVSPDYQTTERATAREGGRSHLATNTALVRSTK